MKTLTIAFAFMGLSGFSSFVFGQSAERLDAFSGDVLVPTLSTTQLASGGEPENEEFRRFLTEVAPDPTLLNGSRIAVLSTDGVEEIEVTGPITYLKERGATVDLVAPRFKEGLRKFGVRYPAQRATHILTVRFFENASWIKIDRFLDEVQPAEYDAVFIPGGAWNPDSLRVDTEALAFVKGIYEDGKPTASICHGPLVFVNAGIARNKQMTAYWNIHLDLQNAGAIVRDQPVVVDGNLITSRFPYDLPHLMQAIVNHLTK